MRFIVTGGAGFIGSHLVKFLLGKKAKVLVIDKLTYAGNMDNLSEVLDDPDFKFIKLDINSTDILRSEVYNFAPEAIFHLAAESHVDRSIISAREFVNTNVNGTLNLLDVGLDFWNSLDNKRQNDFKFIHVSTDEVYGALGVSGKFNENSSYKPNSPYAASKASADLLVRSYNKTYNFPAIVANCCNNYGSHQYPEKLIPLCINHALHGKNLPIYGDGKQVRDWIYVIDHVRALWELYLHGKIGESYGIGANNEIANIDLVNIICKILDRIHPRRSNKSYSDLITFVKDRAGHDWRYAIDATKLQELTKWQPIYNFTEALEATVSWYVAKIKPTLKESFYETAV